MVRIARSQPVMGRLVGLAAAVAAVAAGVLVLSSA